ncbi:Imm21 family immunity protein [Variovorax atrisoli]|uniref:Imm21 family immunity protein n=1 Tax=Variovorax atrisoli TaxID=3394203 RepID=UPI0011A4F18C|nr:MULTISPECIES: Imm21 family immunity protein [Variovorax]MBB3641162.1 hypothetical protein [Variovorax sp. BK613]MDR6522793.1 hypothetical protein [Variovorax paradoxus]
MTINWTRTDGGPFICASPQVGKLWRGVCGTSIGAVETDYERACAEGDYLGIVACGASQVLVLGDEPAQSAFLSTSTGLVIARWIHCESADTARSALEKIPADLPSLQSPVRLRLDEPELWLFDAAADSVNESTGVAAHMPAGMFDITVERYVQGRVFEFWLHRLIRSSE